jgi:hypothetical protein
MGAAVLMEVHKAIAPVLSCPAIDRIFIRFSLYLTGAYVASAFQSGQIVAFTHSLSQDKASVCAEARERLRPYSTFMNLKFKNQPRSVSFKWKTVVMSLISPLIKVHASIWPPPSSASGTSSSNK